MDGQFEPGERVHYKFYGYGTVRERVITENGTKYLIEFDGCRAWMMPNHLLRRANEEAECSKR